MSALATDLSDYVSAARPGSVLAPVPLDGVVQGVVDAMREELADAEVRVEMTDLPPVRGDADLLARLFRDLIGRAAAARTPERAQLVRITAGPADADGHVTVTVRDSGADLAPDEVVRLLSVRDGAPQAGSLAICRRIVRNHGGDIAIRPSPGGGTAVEFSLRAA